MKIIEVNLSENVTRNVGLSPISMKKIGSTILLAGKNGSGKTRILNLIRQQAGSLTSFISNKNQAQNNVINLKQQIEQQPQQKQQLEQNIKTHENNIRNWKHQIEQQPQQKQQIELNIKTYENHIINFKQQIEQEPKLKQQLEQNIKTHENNIKNLEHQIEQQPQHKQQLEQNIKMYENSIKNLKQQIEQQPQHEQQLEQNIKTYENSIRNWKHQIEQQPQQKQQIEQNIKTYENHIINFKQQIEQQPQQKQQLEIQIQNQYNIINTPMPIISDNEQHNIAVVDFVPNKIDLEDWSNHNKREWMQRAHQAKSHGMITLHQSTIPLIQQVMERWVNTSNPKLEFSENEITQSLDNYNRLQDIIQSFLGTQIGWNKDGYSTIFDKPIFQAQLSAGQRVLLQLCVAIYAQGGTLSNHIIFMDEPENHLHPSAVIDLLDTIRVHNPKGQIWIATHSIPLLSHFDASSLWFVEDGAVNHSGKSPEVVLKSLLGDDERVQKLRDFTSLPSELARNRFAFECLCPPTVVETDSKDPQSLQLNEQLKIIWENKTSINLLDFGAGKGRMIANLSDYENVSKDTLNYHAYDPFTSDKDDCLKNISLSYNNAENRYHNSIEDLRTKVDDGYFDVIVLSNVLHEIPHVEWCKTFADIKVLLKENGYLLLIEDCLLPTGELPHSNGFIVFNTLHLKKLFIISASEKKFIQHDARFDSEEKRGRLMAHLIPSTYLSNISQETIQNALKELKESSKTQILKIRNDEPSYANGLAHSFWIQQLANSELCID